MSSAAVAWRMKASQIPIWVKPVTLDGKEIPSIPMESNPTLLRTSDACMGCHDQRNNPHGVPLCQTGNEYTMSESKVNCLSCHMPINDGLADHSMGGGHNERILRRSVVFDVKTEQAGDKIQRNSPVEKPPTPQSAYRCAIQKYLHAAEGL